MKNFILLIAATFLTVGSFAKADLKFGDPIPKADVKMKNIDDTMKSISDVKGKNGTLVVFSCNHCPYARAWEGRIVALAGQAKAKDIGVIMINSNDPTNLPEDSFEGMKKKTYSFPYVVDSTSNLARTFGATKTPDVFLFNKDGALVYKGAVDDNSE